MKIWKIALLMTDMKAARELYVEKLGFTIVNTIDVGEHGMMSCAAFASPFVVRDLMPLDSIVAEFHFGEFKMTAIGIVTRPLQEWIFKNQQVRPIAVDHFVVDELQRDSTAVS